MVIFPIVNSCRAMTHQTERFHGRIPDGIWARSTLCERISPSCSAWAMPEIGRSRSELILWLRFNLADTHPSVDKICPKSGLSFPHTLQSSVRHGDCLLSEKITSCGTSLLASSSAAIATDHNLLLGFCRVNIPQRSF